MIKSLQGLRVLAMLIIFLYHADFFPFGHFTVTFFFILSGFVMYYNYGDTEKSGLLKGSVIYAINRMRKLYSVYILTFCVGAYIHFDVLKKLPHLILLILSLTNIFLLQSFIPNSEFYFSFNGVSWYLSCLFICYLCFNWFKLALNKINNKLIYSLIIIWLFQFVVTYIFKGLDYEKTQWLFYINPFFRSLNFLMGMILAKLFKQSKSRLQYGNINTTRYEFGIIAIFLIIYPLSIFIPRAFIWSVYYSPFLILLIFIFSFERGYVSKLLSKKIFLNLANISFEFYMVHQLVLIWIGGKLKSNKIYIIIVSLILSLVFAKILNKYETKRKYSVIKSLNMEQ